jgi:hypothetical protein
LDFASQKPWNPVDLDDHGSRTELLADGCTPRPHHLTVADAHAVLAVVHASRP